MAEQRILRILITAENEKTILAIIRDHQVDAGCSGGVRKDAQGGARAQAFVSEAQLEALKKHGVKIEVLEDATAKGHERQKEVGRGNRFEGKDRVPHGLGRKLKEKGNVIP